MSEVPEDNRSLLIQRCARAWHPKTHKANTKLHKINRLAKPAPPDVIMT